MRHGPVSDAVAEIVRLEVAVWQALVDGDRSADADLLSEDFLGVYPTGYATRADHLGQLANGPTVAMFELSEVRTIEIGEEAVLVVYRADYRRVQESGSTTPEAETMHVSSLWRRRAGRWVNVFSQDTPQTGIAVV